MKDLKAKVLIVDDDAVLRRGLRRVLTMAGYLVTEAADGSEALKILNTIEDYTAFPSKADFVLFWKLYERSDYQSLARIVGRVVRASEP